jgi:hypothetical protein
MYHVIYDELKRIASAQGRTTYEALASMAGLDVRNPDDWIQLTHLLDQIATHEHLLGRPLLPAVVTLSRSGRKNARPGNGFFNQARLLGRYHSFGERADSHFLQEELSHVYGTWTEERDKPRVKTVPDQGHMLHP